MKNKHLYKFLCIAICLLMLFTCLAACSGKDKDNDTEQTPGGSENNNNNDGGGTPNQGVGPAIGEYYCDVDGGEFLLTVKDGNAFTIKTADSEKSGVFTVNGNALLLDFANDADGTASATFSSTQIVLSYNSEIFTLIPKVSYTVTFETSGGSAVSSQSVVNGKYATRPEDPTKLGSAFIGWYADSAFKTAFDFANTRISADTTVYAKWVIIPAGTIEYTVSFNLGYDGAPAKESQKTLAGKLFNLAAPEREGYTFGGWWISMYDDASKLTCEYTEDTVFTEDTTLFALWTDNSSTKLPAPKVSVTADGVKWNSVDGASAYQVKIYSSTQVFFEKTIGTTSQAYDFTANETSDYIVEVIAVASNTANNSEAAVRYYKGNILNKVSGFTVSDNVLVFSPVNYAEKYYITMVCGNSEHNHEMMDNGTSLTYDFSACPMRPGGIVFTVTASAEGYESSTSAPFVYDFTPTSLLVFTQLDDGTWGVKASDEAMSAEYISIPAIYEGKLVTKILDAAFENYSNLKHISIPDTVTAIGVDAFTGCNGLEGYIVYRGSEEHSYNPVYSSYDGALMFTAPGGETFLEAFPKAKTGTYTIADGVTSILAYAFQDAHISKVVVSTSVVNVPENAFAGCATLEEIEFVGGRSKNVTINPLAFGESNNSITTLKLPALITPFEDARCLEVLHALATLEVEAGSSVYTSVSNLLCNADPALTMLIYAPNNAIKALISEDGVLTIPEGINGIGKNAFYGNTSVNDVALVIPSSVNLIEEEAFASSYFISVTFEGGRFDSLTIGKNAFRSASIREVVFAESAEASNVAITIGESAFDYCSSLATVTVGKNTNIASIGDYAFRNNTKLSTFTVDDNATLTSIGAHAFDYCNKLENLVIHASTKSIGEYAYTKCTALTSVSVASGSTSLTIGDYAFAGCTNLASVTIPNTVNTFNGSVFDGCNKITNMDIADSDAFKTDANGAIYNGNYTELIYCPKDFSDIAGLRWSTLEKIGPSVFKGNKNITSVEFGSKIKEIGAGAFESSSITSVSFASNSNAVKIGDNAFYMCSSLTSASVPDTTTHIGNYAFASTKLNGITLPSALTYIGDSAFNGVTGITSVSIPASVTYIGNSAFYLTGLNSVTVPANSKLETIGDGAFMHTSISAFNMPKTVVYIGESAFEGTALTSVVIPATTTTVGNKAFKISTLTSVVFDKGGDAALTVGEQAFGGSAITAVELPARLESIGRYYEHYSYHTVEEVFSNTLASLTVEAGCATYKTIDDVLYMIDGENLILVYCPRAKTGVVSIPTNVVLVEAKAFNGVQLSGIIFEEYDKSDERYGKPTLTIGSFVNVQADSGISPQDCATIANAPNLNLLHFPSHLKAMNSYAVSTMVIGKRDAFMDIQFNVDCVDGVSFESHSMYNISRVKTITLPKINHIGTYAFQILGDNLESITFTDGSTFTEIPDYAFSGNASTPFTRFVVPAGVKVIGNSAFSGCSNLQELVLLGDAVEQIGDMAFQSTGLKSFKIPTSVKVIGSGVFTGCRDLVTIEFSENIETIVLQTSMLGSAIHRNCSSLTEFIVPETNPYFKSENGMLLSKDGTILYAVPALAPLNIPESVTTIASGAFGGYAGKTVVIPSFITTVQSWAFQYSLVEHIEWRPEGSTVLSDEAFANMSNVKTFIMGDNVTWKADEKALPPTIKASTAEKNGINTFVKNNPGLNADLVRLTLAKFKGFGYFTNITSPEPTAEEIALINAINGNNAEILIAKWAEYKAEKFNEQLANDLSDAEIAGIEKFVTDNKVFYEYATLIKTKFIEYKNSGALDKVTDANLTKEETEMIRVFLTELFLKDDKLIGMYTPILEGELMALKQSIIDGALNAQLTPEEVAGIEKLVSDYRELFDKAGVIKTALINYKNGGYLNNVVSAEVTAEEQRMIEAFLNETFMKDTAVVEKYLPIFTEKLAAYKQAIIDSSTIGKVELTDKETSGIEKLASTSDYFKGRDAELKEKFLQFKKMYLVRLTSAEVSEAEIQFIEKLLVEMLGAEMYEKDGGNTLKDFTTRLRSYKQVLFEEWLNETLTREEIAGIEKIVAEFGRELGISVDTFKIALAQFKTTSGCLSAPYSKDLTAEEIQFIASFIAANIKDEGVAKGWTERFQQKLMEYKMKLQSAWLSEVLDKEDIEGIEKLASETSKELGLNADVFKLAFAQYKTSGYLTAPYSKELSAEELQLIANFVAANIKDEGMAKAWEERFQQKLMEYKMKLQSAWLSEVLTKEEMAGIDNLASETSKELGLNADVFKLAFAQFKAAGYLSAPYSKELTAGELQFIADFVAANIKDEGMAKAWEERFQQKLMEYKMKLQSTWLSSVLTKEEMAGIDTLVSEHGKELGISVDTFKLALAQFREAGYFDIPFSKELTAEEIQFIADFVAANIKDEGVAKGWMERFQQKLIEYKVIMTKK